MKKYYIGGLLTLVTIAFATVTLAVNKDVIGYRRYIYIHRPQKQVVLCLLLLRYTELFCQSVLWFMRFTDTFIKMNSCVVGATVGRPFCVIKFAIVYENFGVATGGRQFA